MFKLREMKNNHFDSLFFQIFNFSIFFGFYKILASNAQAKPNIKKGQLLHNDAKNLICEEFKF